MANINLMVLSGNLGSKPQVKQTKNGKSYCWLSIATSEYYNEERHTDWHSVKVYGPTADRCEKFLEKGQSVDIIGKLKTDKWNDNGTDKTLTYVVANTVTFGPKMSREEKEPF